MKILSIDYGEKRVGLALSDETQTIASPLPTLKVKSLADAVSKTQQMISSQKIEKVLIGLPLGPNREETQQSIKTRYFGDALGRSNGMKPEYWNESLSTQEANKSKRLGTKRKKRNLDSEAARIILQEYLDFKKEPTSPILPQYKLAV